MQPIRARWQRFTNQEPTFNRGMDVDWAELVYAVAAVASGGAALLAWAAKLRWAQEYRAATEQVIKAKDAEIGSLKTQIDVLQAVSSGKILEHAASTRQGLEDIISRNEEELKGARATIEGLKIEISDLRTPGSHLHPATEVAHLPSGGTTSQLTERAESLEDQLREAQREERLLREKHLTFRMIALEDAPELVQRYAAELEARRVERAGVEAELEDQKTVWLRDKQDAETRLQTYRDRGTELREQIRQLRELGPEGACTSCGRPVGAEYEQHLEEMEDMLGEVVQDGKWWKNRVDQLKTKPEDITALERMLRYLSDQIDDATRKHSRAQAAAQELEEVRRELSAIQSQRSEDIDE